MYVKVISYMYIYIEVISIVLSPLPQVYHNKDCVVVQRLFVCQSGGIFSLVVSLFMESLSVHSVQTLVDSQYTQYRH